MQEFFITIELGRGNSEQIRRKQGRQDLTVIWRLCCLNYDQRDVEISRPHSTPTQQSNKQQKAMVELM
jgi:hypothetical protein